MNSVFFCIMVHLIDIISVVPNADIPTDTVTDFSGASLYLL